MAPSKCCVTNCNSTRDTHCLYNLPKDDKLRSLWMSFLLPICPQLNGLTTKQLLNKSVCHLHFDRYQMDGQGRRMRFSYPSLFSDKEILHGVPLSSDEYTVMTEHNYVQEREEDVTETERILIVGSAALTSPCVKEVPVKIEIVENTNSQEDLESTITGVADRNPAIKMQSYNKANKSVVLERILCINCSICVNSVNTRHRYRVLEQHDKVAALIGNWVSPVVITEEDYICERCYNLAEQAVVSDLDGNNDICAKPRRGHRIVCLFCGRSLADKYHYNIFSKFQPDSKFVNLIKSKIAPRQILPSDCLCHACYMRVKRKAYKHQTSGQKHEHSDQNPANFEHSDLHHANSEHSDHYRANSGYSDLHHAGSANSDHHRANSENSDHHRANVEHSDLHHAISEHSDQDHTEYDQSDHDQSQSDPGRFTDVVNPAEADPLAETDNSLQDSINVQKCQQEIILTSYKRAQNTASQCIFHGCNNISNLCSVTESFRKKLLVNYKYYLPMHSRICLNHLSKNNFDLLYNAENSLSNFNVAHIEHMLSFLHSDQ